MISLRGPKLKILAAVLAVIALAAGIYLTFFRSQGFVKATGTIVSLREDSSDDSSVYFPTVEYTLMGRPIPASWTPAAAPIRSARPSPFCTIPMTRRSFTTEAAWAFIS